MFRTANLQNSVIKFHMTKQCTMIYTEHKEDLFQQHQGENSVLLASVHLEKNQNGYISCKIDINAYFPQYQQ